MDRERLTITLKKDIVRLLDKQIDGVTLRNRSHAIETYLEHALTTNVTQAVILAGGKGVKMRPLTYEVPKALIPVHGKPILEYLIDALAKHTIRSIVLAVGHLGDKIQNHFGDGSRYGVKITYSKEIKPLGTAGALCFARTYLANETVVVLHGDMLVEIDFSELIRFHHEQHTIGTIALTTAADTSTFGAVNLRGSRIVDFIEKPEKGKTSSLLVNSGIYVFEPEIFDYIPQNKAVMLEDIFPKLATEAKLSGFPFEGRWFDVSTPKTYEQAIKYY